MQARVLGALGVGGVVVARQVHGAEVAHGRASRSRATRSASREADGVATALPGVAAAVHVADCLPVAVGGEGAVAMLHCGWRGLAGGIVAAGVARAARGSACDGAARRRRSARASAAAATRPARRCASASRPTARAPGRLLDLKAVAAAQLREAGVGARRGRRRVHDLLDAGRLLLPPPRRRRRAGARGASRGCALSVERVRDGARRGARARRRRRARAPAATRPPSRSSLAVKYVGADDIETLADAGVTLVGENRAQELLEKVDARPGAPALALHRRAAVAQGPPDRAARRADPLGRERLGAARARPPRAARLRDPRRGQRRAASRARPGSRPASSTPSSRARRSRSPG